MEDLINYVEQQTRNVDVIYDHYKAGTIEDLYKRIIKDTVVEMMLLPLRRHERDLPLLDNPESISNDVVVIAGIIGATCGKPIKTVELDLMTAVNDFPADDIRQSSFLRKANRLN